MQTSGGRKEEGRVSNLPSDMNEPCSKNKKNKNK
jgi:hypothetical protein